MHCTCTENTIRYMQLDAMSPTQDEWWMQLMQESTIQYRCTRCEDMGQCNAMRQQGGYIRD